MHGPHCLFVDMEWEVAHDSSGAPLSIGIAHADGRHGYAEWDIAHRQRISDWAAMQVLPRLQGGPYEPKRVPYMPLSRVLDIICAHTGPIWAGERATVEWLQLLGVHAEVFPGVISAHEQNVLFWHRQAWQDTEGEYHAWIDARGMAEGANKMGWFVL